MVPAEAPALTTNTEASGALTYGRAHDAPQPGAIPLAVVAALAALGGAAQATTADSQVAPTAVAPTAAVSGQGTWETTLLARDLDGNAVNGPEAFHDTALNITWLRNANVNGMMAWASATT